MAREKYFPTVLLMLDDKSSQRDSSTEQVQTPTP